MRKILAAVALLLVAAPAAAQQPSLAARNAHVLVGKTDGSVSAWGSDLFGKLGTGRAILRQSPQKVPVLPPVAQIATYSYGFHFVAQDTAGRVWTWGQNDFGQLGPRVQRDAAIPGRVQGLSNVIQVAATSQASLALRNDGTVWLWGDGPWGAFPTPTKVATLSNVTQIVAGSNHYFARKADGTVWVAGWNNQNQLGLGAPSPVFSQYGNPTQLALPAPAVEVAATTLGGAVRLNNGQVYSWGASSFESVGVVSPREITGFPVGTTVVKLVGEMSAYHAVLNDGRVVRWTDAPSAPGVVSSFANVVSIAGENEGLDDGSDYLAVGASGVMSVRSSNAYGQRGSGVAGLTDGLQVTQVPSPTNFSFVRWANHCVLALTTTGELWAWGAEVNGSFGDGARQAYSAARSVAGVANVKQVAAGLDFSAAVTVAGNVFVWGDNQGGLSGDGEFSPVSTPVQVPISNVATVATGWFHMLFAKNDGTVWITGFFNGTSFDTPTQVAIPGNVPIVGVAAGNDSSYAWAADGRLYAWGSNLAGEVGNGTQQSVATPLQVVVPGGVAKVATETKTVLAATPLGEVYGWGEVDTRNLFGVESNSGDVALVPTKVPGIASAVDVAVGQFHFLARKSDNTLVSWGGDFFTEALGREADVATPAWVPSPVLEIDSVIAIAAANSAAYAIRSDGTVWGWGVNWASGAGPTTGDGTFVRRARPVVAIRENGAGAIDTNDWFLDTKPGTQKSIPAAKVPKLVSVSQSLSGTALLNVNSAVRIRAADQAKTLGVYVTALVPPAFLSQVNAAPGAVQKAAQLKDTLILVNLTPAGWTVASGQLVAFASGVGSGLTGALNILTNINPATIPGARFCIGYGESATDMLRTGTISDFLSLPGAASSAAGLPCLLSGVYVDGPRSSAQGTAVPVRAVVIGQGPTGTVQFQERFTTISGAVAISPINAAVSDATFSYTPPAAGDYSFAASYSGDLLNPPMASEVPLLHHVNAVPGPTTTRIEGPVSTEVGAELRLAALVNGNAPGGTVQFKRGGVNEGVPVPVVAGQASLSLVGLPIGAYSFTAEYSGDGSNSPSASAAFAHQVLNVASSAAVLTSSANPVAAGTAITLSVVVSGTNPAGTVTLRDGADVLASKSLASGAADFVVTGLAAGVHAFAVDYAGDGSNPATTSNTVFQQMTIAGGAAGDADGDGIPNAVEQAEGRNPFAKDNDLFTSGRLFAMQQYRDFLAREGDAGGINFWASQVASGGATRGQVVDSFFSSPEFQGNIAPVARLYFAYFLRIPDYPGLNFWIGYYKAGNPLAAISQAFATSPEFGTRYGALDNGQFVDLVYQNVLGRAADAPGRAFWKGQLDTGAMDRGTVMLGFSESDEYKLMIASEVYVTMIYNGMLRRAPDAGGFSFWVQYRDAGNSGLALIDLFLGTPEYRARFLP